MATTSMINYYRAGLRGSNVGTSLMNDPFLKVKTLILWGEKDSVLVVELAHASFKYCPEGSKLVLIPNGTHWVTLEEPVKITNEIVSFVANKNN
jgi:pimeloyl-ACP methyl ester carboxylesterase